MNNRVVAGNVRNHPEVKSLYETWVFWVNEVNRLTPVQQDYTKVLEILGITNDDKLEDLRIAQQSERTSWVAYESTAKDVAQMILKEVYG